MIRPQDIGICKTCGEKFKKKSPNQNHCPAHTSAIPRSLGYKKPPEKKPDKPCKRCGKILYDNKKQYCLDCQVIRMRGNN